MRPDLDKCTTECYRRGAGSLEHTYKIKFGGKVKVDPDPEHEYDNERGGFHSSARHRHKASKDFVDKLGALRGNLKANLGRRWDDVFSEFCQNLDRRGVSGHHFVRSSRATVKERDAKCRKCGNSFVSRLLHKEWTEYCNRSCASLSSVTGLRRSEAKRMGHQNSGNLLADISIMMKQREKWKYKEVADAIRGESHEFEFPLGGYVFDLVLFDRNLIVEFDADNHRIDAAQILIDKAKDAVAKSNGFDIVRIAVQAGRVIPRIVIFDIDLRTSTVGGSIFGLGSRMPTPPPNLH